MLFAKFTNNIPWGILFKSHFSEFPFEAHFEFFHYQDSQYFQINGTGTGQVAMQLAIEDGLLSFSSGICCSATLEVLGRIFGFVLM